jgi:membrane protease YdiL (CAAX protease family)
MMKQHSKSKSILYHLYPGLLITLFFVGITPLLIRHGLPPQLTMLLAIALIVTPVILIHLYRAKSEEGVEKIRDLIGYKEKLPRMRLILYSLGLIAFAYLVYGLTQPLNTIISARLFSWLPEWYQVRDFEGYSQRIVVITLLLNILLNGLLAPFLEEIYFRGYLLPRMKNWGKFAPVLSALLFSLYHFWQPQIYLTLFIALIPMVWLTWKTKSIRLAIYTHCGLNIVGALLSLGLIFQ